MFGSNFIMYCNKCGYVDIRHQHHTCPFCKKLLKASDRVFINKTIRYKEENEQIENDIFQRLVKGNKAFDASAYENRIQQMRQQEEEIEKYIFEPSESEIKAAIEQTKIIQEQLKVARERASAEQANAPRCPTCGNTDLKKIDALDRAISVSFLGLASGKIGKSFKCNHCGYIW